MNQNFTSEFSSAVIWYFSSTTGWVQRGKRNLHNFGLFQSKTSNTIFVIWKLRFRIQLNRRMDKRKPPHTAMGRKLPCPRFSRKFDSIKSMI